MSKTVLAVDVGSATITAAVAGGDADGPAVLQPLDAPWWPAAVHVDTDGSLILNPVLYQDASYTITRFTRFLGQQAQVISGEVRHADALVATALTPVISAAAVSLDAEIDLLVATYPSTWPEQIVTAYRHAISEVAPVEAILVPWADAAAAGTNAPDPFVNCPVTSLDFGARSATVTMARVDQQGKARTEYSITNPGGGLTQVAMPIIAEIAQSLSAPIPGELEDPQWWELAVSAFGDARADPERAWTGQGVLPEGSMLVEFPAPLGLLNLTYREVSEMIVEQLTEPVGPLLQRVGFAPPPPDRAHLSLLDQLLNRAPVQGRWTVDGHPHAARPLVEMTGGFAQDPAVQQAVRAVTRSEPVVAEFPAHAAAYGAAILGARASARLVGSRR